MKKLILPALLAALVAGCSSTPDATDANAPVEGRNGVATVNAGNMDGRNLPAVLTDPKSILSKRSIYFALDRYDVSEQYRALVNAHAKFLVENRQFKILIQGNTDERGTSEYNLALGQKRSEAVRRALGLLGVSDAQLEAVSFGKEKPAAQGGSEDVHAQNRRAELSYR